MCACTSVGDDVVGHGEGVPTADGSDWRVPRVLMVVAFLLSTAAHAFQHAVAVLAAMCAQLACLGMFGVGCQGADV